MERSFLIFFALLTFYLARSQGAELADFRVRQHENGSGFELSGKIVILVEATGIDRHDACLSKFVDRLATLTGFEPKISLISPPAGRKFVLRTGGLEGDFSARVSVLPDLVIIEGKTPEDLRNVLSKVAEMIGYESKILSRTEIHNWVYVQNPDRICRWIYSFPAMTMEFHEGVPVYANTKKNEHLRIQD